MHLYQNLFFGIIKVYKFENQTESIEKMLYI